LVVLVALAASLTPAVAAALDVRRQLAQPPELHRQVRRNRTATVAVDRFAKQRHQYPSPGRPGAARIGSALSPNPRRPGTTKDRQANSCFNNGCSRGPTFVFTITPSRSMRSRSRAAMSTE